MNRAERDVLATGATRRRQAHRTATLPSPRGLVQRQVSVVRKTQLVFPILFSLKETAMRSMMIFLLFLALAGPALAVDGVLEINQTCAVQTGCFPNDGPGYPIFIDQPGSYRLTSNLVVLNENTDGIRIGASSISIDLNGFEIVRQGCEGAAVACVPESGIGSGIELSAVAEDARGISVKNGSIVGMGAHGVALGGGAAQLHDVLREGRAGSSSMKRDRFRLWSNGGIFGGRIRTTLKDQ
jgi:hypothetical protein